MARAKRAFAQLNQGFQRRGHIHVPARRVNGPRHGCRRARRHIRHPFFGIDHLPCLIAVAAVGEHIGKLVDHLPPGGDVAVLKVEQLGVGAVAHDHRIASLGDRPVHVGAKDQAVIHRERHIPVDAHSITGFAADRSLELGSGDDLLVHRTFLADLVAPAMITSRRVGSLSPADMRALPVGWLKLTVNCAAARHCFKVRRCAS